MANQFSASIYRINANDLKVLAGVPAVLGVVQSFPSQGVRIYPVQGTVTANGVTMASIIALLPSGLVQPEKLFYSDASVSTLVTAANA